MPRRCAVCGMTLSVDARLEHADRDHRRLQRIDVARDDRLRALMICAPTSTVSIVACGRAACPPLPSISMIKAVGGRHHGPRPEARNAPTGEAGIIVHAVDLLDARSAPSARPAPWPCRRRRPPRPAGRSPRRCRRSCVSRRDISRRPAAWRCGRHGRRHASCPARSTCRAGRWPPRSAAHPCRRAAR